MHIIDISVGDIRLPKKQYKEHPEKQLRQLISSIEQYGFNDPVALDEKGNIIEGVGRVMAAQKLGLETIPVIKLTHLSAKERKAYILAHNKICLNSGFDLDLLRETFDELCVIADDNHVDYMTGFENIEVDELFKVEQLPQLGQELTSMMTMQEGIGNQSMLAHTTGGSIDTSEPVQISKEDQSIDCPHCGGTICVAI